MVKIAIIRKNRCNFDRMADYVLPLLYNNDSKPIRNSLKSNLNDYLWSVISPYITFVEISEDNDLFSIICDTTKNDFPDKDPDLFMYNTESSFSTPKRHLELINVCPTWKSYQNSMQDITVINNIGCLLSLKHTAIENTCFVIVNEYDLNAPKYVKLTSITEHDILRIIRRRYFHTAILIQEKSIEKYYFQDPEYLLSMIFGKGESEKMIQTLPVNCYNYNLIFHFNKNQDAYANQIATRINGKYHIHGDVLVFHEMDKDIFINLGIREFKRINILSYGSLKNREPSNSEIFQISDCGIDENGNEKKNTVPFWSKYLIIENRMLQWKKNKDKCTHCHEFKINNNISTCTQCYRFKFCCIECAQSHNSECTNSEQ
jgi:hypothetical protein